MNLSKTSNSNESCRNLLSVSSYALDNLFLSSEQSFPRYWTDEHTILFGYCPQEVLPILSVVRNPEILDRVQGYLYL